MAHTSPYSNEDETTRRERLLKEAEILKTEGQRDGINTDFAYRLYQVAENPEADDVPISDSEIETIWKLAEKKGLTFKDSLASICQSIYRNCKAKHSKK